MSNNSCVRRLMKQYQHLTYSFVNYTELLFYKLGVKVGSNPLTTISFCWVFVLLSAFGFLRFHQEKNPMKLWVPPYTSFVSDTDWLMKRYQNGYRTEAMLIKAPDVLTPEVLQEFHEIHKRIISSVADRNVTWPDICFQIPELDLGMSEFLVKSYKGSKNGSQIVHDPSVDMNAATYCSFVDSMGIECLEKSILELWNFKDRKIKNLTKDEIINKLNRYIQNPILRKIKNYENLLGGVERNATGHIVSATTLHNFWMVSVNFSAVDMDKSGNMAGTADWASEETLLWELEFIKIAENASKFTEHFDLYYAAARSFGDISNSTMFQDMDILVLGVFIMVFYVQFVISKYNWLEARIVLSCVGLLSVGMSFVVACGLCSAIGVSYGPVHTSLPFLLMGLGVDDMFVIMACWDDLSITQKQLPLHERIGLMLKHAGVSITVTSVTDVLAFIVGSSTILPCLESFCIYAAMGVLMIFIFTVTFFTACFTLDQKRVELQRNGIVPCYTHRDYHPNKCSERQFSNKLFNIVYSKIFFTIPGKVAVILLTIVFAGFSIQATLKLEQRFDPIWFVPPDTYFFKYMNERTTYYPTMGFEAGLYMGALNYSQELRNIQRTTDMLLENDHIITDFNSWVNPFRDFVYKHFRKDIYVEELSTNEFNLFLSKFLFSPFNAIYQANFKFEKPLECGIPAPNITMSSIDFRFHFFNKKEDYLPAMHTTINISKNINFTTGDKFATVWSKIFAWWITDELIDIEVMRNLQLALLCVMVSTVLLIANLQICFWVFICVLLTMINVCGFMQRWGLSIDLVSCIGLELAIGLCVDYASHIGHTFLTVEEGNRTERSLKTVTTIGSAVMYGGLSTFIGVSMLGFSKAYTFRAFFKIFLLVIFFGLFHGIVLLPVILSWIGPKPYRSHKPLRQSDNDNEIELK